MKLRYWTILLLILVVAVSGCSRGRAGSGDVNVDLSVEPNPPTVGPATVTVTLTDLSGEPITGADVALEGNMNHAGMVPVNAEATETGPGQYEADIEFTMGGDWFVIVSATLPNGEEIEEQIDVGSVTGQQ